MQVIFNIVVFTCVYSPVVSTMLIVLFLLFFMLMLFFYCYFSKYNMWSLICFYYQSSGNFQKSFNCLRNLHVSPFQLKNQFPWEFKNQWKFGETFNTTTVRPKYFGRINGVVALTGVGIILQHMFFMRHVKRIVVQLYSTVHLYIQSQRQ